MRHIIKLPNRDIPIDILDHRRAIPIRIKVVRSGEDSDKGGEVERRGAVHAVSCVLGFMCADDAEKVVAVEEAVDGVVAWVRQHTLIFGTIVQEDTYS